MLTILAVCTLAAQMVFTPPEGWTVVSVYTGGRKLSRPTMTSEYCNSECEARREHPSITLQKMIKVGDVVEGPQGCTLTMSLREVTP